MTKKLSEEQIYEEAKKRVEAKRGFYSHLAAYVIVNIMLVLIWWFAAGGLIQRNGRQIRCEELLRLL